MKQIKINFNNEELERLGFLAYVYNNDIVKGYYNFLINDRKLPLSLTDNEFIELKMMVERDVRFKDLKLKFEKIKV